MQTVSIVIPVYNREHLVRRAIESAINQTYKDVEIIVVDNCSTDDTWRVVCEYQSSDSRVRCYRNPNNIGPVANWRRGVLLSEGNYVKLLFSDDWLEPHSIEIFLRSIERQHSVGFVYSSVYGHIRGNSPVVWYQRQREGVFPSYEFLWEFATGGNVPVSPGAALFRREDLLEAIEIGIPNRALDSFDFNMYGIGNDALIFWRICERYPLVAYIREPLVHFAEPEKDQPGFTMGLIRSGQGHVVSLGYKNAFAYFLATCSLPDGLKGQLYTAWLVSSVSMHPVRLMRDLGTYVRLFPDGYPRWRLALRDQRILKLLGRRFGASLIKRLRRL